MHDALQPTRGLVREELNKAIQGLRSGRVESLQLLFFDGVF
jgi:hypothetical protein